MLEFILLNNKTILQKFTFKILFQFRNTYGMSNYCYNWIQQFYFHGVKHENVCIEFLKVVTRNLPIRVIILIVQIVTVTGTWN